MEKKLKALGRSFSTMRKLTSLVLLAFSFTANATTYYFSTTGNDANNGTSTTTPWKTLTKFNSVFSSLKPGDNVLFNRGNVFYGRINITKAGSSGSPITIGAYGTGAMPVITGFTTVSAWTSLGSNIWESTSAVSALPYTNMVAVGGVNTPMGRYPNTGYLVWQSHTGNVKNSASTITSSALTGSPNWTGAEIAFNSTTYIVSRDKITAQSGGTLTYTAPNPADLFQTPSTYFIQSFIIQNDARTLDAKNEWYYNPSTKKLRIYNTTTPSNVQIATVDTLVYINGRSYITFDNVSFQGANASAIECSSNSTYITIQNCDFNFSGKNAIHGLYNSNLANIKVVNCTINHSNNNAIEIGISANAVIQQNTIKNTGMIRGMICVGGKTGIAILAEGTNELIQNNAIDSVGYSGIRFLGSNTIIRNNYVKNFCSVQYDGGGIQTWNGPLATYSGIKIQNNILLNGNGVNHGIYLDYAANGVEVSGNTISNCQRGVYLNNGFNVQILNNTTFSTDYGILLDKSKTAVSLNNIIMKNNILVAKTATQRPGFFLTILSASMPMPYTTDSNYYARPVDDNLTIQTNFNGVYTQRTFAGWQALNNQDAHSHKSPKAITDTNDLVLEFNETSAGKTISLPYNYVDVKNVSYNGSITLAPYTSAVLIKNGAVTGNKPPVANAGADKSITLPTTSVALAGSGTDPDGTISAYAWTKISGPAATIVSPASASTSLTGLTQGTYKLQLKVTDNKGATDTDTLQVTVNATSSLLPAVNPANTVNGLDYRYYEGTFAVVPSFSSLTPVKTGTTTTPNLSFAERTYGYSFNFTGFINVPADGQYTFYTTSDDGSKLDIDNVLVVNNDGLHTSLEKSGVVGLKAGKHAISIGYTQGTGGNVLSVSYVGPGVIKQVLGASVLYRISAQSLSMSANTNEVIASSTQVSVKAYPNPFANYVEINITGNVAGEYKLMMVDVSGKVLWTKSGIKNAGDFQQSINTSALQRGIYFLKVIQNNTTSTIKVVK